MEISQKTKHVPLQDLYDLLTSSTEPVHTKQLVDGRIYVYTDKALMAYFRYYGSPFINDLRLNTRRYIGKKLDNKASLIKYPTELKNKLIPVLKELFPDAHLCNPTIKHALELAAIEAAILDTSTEIEISNISQNERFDVAIYNNADYISSSFRYKKKSGVMKNVFLRYHHHITTVETPRIWVPPHKRIIFENLLNNA